jgi:3'-phosphoadenosine 5'-phosphosulfate sulfotransferase (PAPS reductase)/FAD synthetase
MLGTMAHESKLRYSNWMKNGCNSFDSKNPSSQPLSFWTEQDILQYIKEYNIPYCSVYGDIIEVDGKLKTTGCDRTGCIFCGFGCHLEKEPSRFQRLKETHPRQYAYCIGGGE